MKKRNARKGGIKGYAMGGFVSAGGAFKSTNPLAPTKPGVNKPAVAPAAPVAATTKGAAPVAPASTLAATAQAAPSKEQFGLQDIYGTGLPEPQARAASGGLPKNGTAYIWRDGSVHDTPETVVPNSATENPLPAGTNGPAPSAGGATASGSPLSSGGNAPAGFPNPSAAPNPSTPAPGTPMVGDGFSPQNPAGQVPLPNGNVTNPNSPMQAHQVGWGWQGSNNYTARFGPQAQGYITRMYYSLSPQQQQQVDPFNTIASLEQLTGVKFDPTDPMWMNEGGRVTKRDKFIEDQERKAMGLPPVDAAKAAPAAVKAPEKKEELSPEEKALLEKYRRKTFFEKAKAAVGLAKGGRAQARLAGIEPISQQLDPAMMQEFFRSMGGGGMGMRQMGPSMLPPDMGLVAPRLEIPAGVDPNAFLAERERAFLARGGFGNAAPGADPWTMTGEQLEGVMGDASLDSEGRDWAGRLPGERGRPMGSNSRMNMAKPSLTKPGGFDPGRSGPDFGPFAPFPVNPREITQGAPDFGPFPPRGTAPSASMAFARPPQPDFGPINPNGKGPGEPAGNITDILFPRNPVLGGRDSNGADFGPINPNAPMGNPAQPILLSPRGRAGANARHQRRARMGGIAKTAPAEDVPVGFADGGEVVGGRWMGNENEWAYQRALPADMPDWLKRQFTWVEDDSGAGRWTRTGLQDSQGRNVVAIGPNGENLYQDEGFYKDPSQRWYDQDLGYVTDESNFDGSRGRNRRARRSRTALGIMGALATAGMTGLLPGTEGGLSAAMGGGAEGAAGLTELGSTTGIDSFAGSDLFGALSESELAGLSEIAGEMGFEMPEIPGLEDLGVNPAADMTASANEFATQLAQNASAVPGGMDRLLQWVTANPMTAARMGMTVASLAGAGRSGGSGSSSYSPGGGGTYTPGGGGTTGGSTGGGGTTGGSTGGGNAITALSGLSDEELARYRRYFPLEDQMLEEATNAGSAAMQEERAAAAADDVANQFNRQRGMTRRSLAAGGVNPDSVQGAALMGEMGNSEAANRAAAMNQARREERDLGFNRRAAMMGLGTQHRTAGAGLAESQRNFDERVRESNRNFDERVRESNRNFDERVRESNRNFDLDVFRVNNGLDRQRQQDRRQNLSDIGSGIRTGLDIWNNGGRDAWNGVTDWLGSFKDGGKARLRGVKPFMAGGEVSGPGDGTVDTVPAMLADGEMVVNAEGTALLDKVAPGLLEEINKRGLQIRKMRDGGRASAKRGVC